MDFKKPLPELMREAWFAQKTAAQAAFDLFDSYCSDGMRRKVPGMGTTERLAVRLHLGKTVEEAAAAEYLYRWRLAIKAPDQCLVDTARNPVCSVFGTPHTIGL